MKTVVIPSGDKPSVVADAPEDYAKDTSPDKVSTTAVWCFLLLRCCSLPRKKQLPSVAVEWVLCHRLL